MNIQHKVYQLHLYYLTQLIKKCLTKLTISIYVDDITFSSNKPITTKTKKNIIKIIESYGYKIKLEKTKYYNKNKHKNVTGVIISKDHKLKIPNKIRESIIKQTPPKIKHKDGTLKDINQCQLGRINFARTIEPNSFTSKLNEIKTLINPKNTN